MDTSHSRDRQGITAVVLDCVSQVEQRKREKMVVREVQNMAQRKEESHEIGGVHA